MLTLKNPHSVLAAIKTRPHDVIEVLVSDDSSGGWDEVVALAKEKKVRVGSAKAAAKLIGNYQSQQNRTALAEARIKERDEVPIETIFGEEKSDSGLWIALDQVQDPHNVGAIFRTASFFGVKGIVFPKDRAASLSAIVYDVASGGVETVPFATCGNLKQALEIGKEKGLWVLGSSEHAKQPLKEVKADRAWLLVLGNEEKGMRRLTEESCDVVVKIPCLSDGVTSLNVSVAAGILMARLSLPV